MAFTAFKTWSRIIDKRLDRFDEVWIRKTVNQLTRSRGSATALLVVLCAVLYLPGINRIPPLDRDEPRYTQASRQMVETGDYTKMYFQERFRNRKPIGIYWLQSASVNLLGGERVRNLIWPYRIPSVLCAIGSVLLVFRLGFLLLGRPQGLMAALMMAVTPLLLAIARVGTTDSALLFVTTTAQYNLIRIYLANRGKEPSATRNMIVFWLALGVGILVKGPITPLIALLTASSLMILHRDKTVLKGLRPLVGIPLMLAVVLPWLISIQIATDGAFLQDSFGSDFGKKLLSGQESHGAPPGFYILMMAVTCWPASLLVIPALVDAWKHRRTQIITTIGFSWIIPYLILIELTPTKLPHYILCIYPPIILLCIRFAWDGLPETLDNWILRAVHWVYTRLWILFFPLAACVLLLSAVVNRMPLLSLFAGSALAFCAFILIKLSRKSPLCRLFATIPLLALMSLLVFGVVMPQLSSLWVSQSAARVFWQIKAEHPTARLYAVGYREPSLVFLTETGTRLCRKDVIKAEYGPNMVAFLPLDMAAEINHPLIKIATVEGINYSKGKVVKAGIYIHPSLQSETLKGGTP